MCCANTITIGRPRQETARREAVRRPEYRDAKARRLLQTAQRVAGPSGQAPGVRLTDDAGCEHRGVELVLVSNNTYSLERPLSAAPGRHWTAASLGS
jgi:hypothetical protein